MSFLSRTFACLPWIACCAATWTAGCSKDESSGSTATDTETTTTATTTTTTYTPSCTATAVTALSGWVATCQADVGTESIAFGPVALPVGAGGASGNGGATAAGGTGSGGGMAQGGAMGGGGANAVGGGAAAGGASGVVVVDHCGDGCTLANVVKAPVSLTFAGAGLQLSFDVTAEDATGTGKYLITLFRDALCADTVATTSFDMPSYAAAGRVQTVTVNIPAPQSGEAFTGWIQLKYERTSGTGLVHLSNLELQRESCALPI